MLNFLKTLQIFHARPNGLGPGGQRIKEAKTQRARIRTLLFTIHHSLLHHSLMNTIRFIFFHLSLFAMLSCALRSSAHPSIAIVKDSKGNIYYSDLGQVWKIGGGKKSIAVANVHTHELFIDVNDNLVGEHLWYDGDASGKFYHYLWRLEKNGKLDTIFTTTQAYSKFDFSIAGIMMGINIIVSSMTRYTYTSARIQRKKK